MCVLFYGSDRYCEDLARRVLNGPMQQLAAAGAEFRLGFNASSSAVKRFTWELFCDAPGGVSVVDCPENIYKYPMMRRLFYCAPWSKQYVMWFDDNSYIDPGTHAVSDWLARVVSQLRGAELLGSVHKTALVGDQQTWIRAQPWYQGRPVKSYVTHINDSWWAARAEPLINADWPHPALRHHGGDVMLGALWQQLGYRLAHFREGVSISANHDGVEGANRVRGFNAAPIGFSFKPDLEVVS